MELCPSKQLVQRPGNCIAVHGPTTELLLFLFLSCTLHYWADQIYICQLQTLTPTTNFRIPPHTTNCTPPYRPLNHTDSQASLVKDLGKGVDLTVCKAACVAAAACGYVSHADQTDLRCMLYSNCSTPMCSPHPRESGWFTTYQYGRPGSQSWTECIPTPSPPPPPPPPPPPSSSMTVRVVNSAIVKKHGAKCLDGTPPAYKIRQGSGENASKFIFFMEGGGWCE